jgi:hypothetical protein
MTAYDDFLASKRRSVHDIGPSADASDVHPLLHDWQAEIVTWAVRKGRAAVFADCGLGKTFIQLEWARLWSNPGELICSPFAGIGSEGHVALLAKRRFVGCELKASYWQTACANLANAEAVGMAPTLFDDIA